MRLVERREDLFNLDYVREYCLCHCVSEDLAMGKGIAALFRNEFGGIEELRKQRATVGDVATLALGDCVIYYMITKAKYWNKPTYEDLEKSLLRVKNDMLTRGLGKLAMPKIGCGLDGLEWNRVRRIIEKVFLQSGIDVLVCIK
jgi:O-acetyl-ADP-ribose deacetylase (regulator of RNase III)